MTLHAPVKGTTEGLSAEERDQFYNNQVNGGTVTVTEYTDNFVVEANGLPDHTMSRNTVSQNFQFTFYKQLEFACTPGSLPKGIIALTKTGVAIYNPLTSDNLNAVEGGNVETFDRCNGHADANGVYHYHQSPGSDDCGDTNTEDYDQFIGVALDGFPIYGPYASDKGSEPLTADDLDICHGRMVDGKYRYHLTSDFPYVLGCYWGADARNNSNRVSYSCDLNVGTDLPEYGYLCCNVDQRNVDSTVCSSYPGTVDVTTDDGGTDAPTQAPTTAAPTTAATTTQAPRTRRPKGGRRSRVNKPDPAREAHLKKWLRQLLKETK
ncbi:uncharacterized protein LOC134272871 [Saccostrea cucullata]|uniref:uncharacterized protein LOC134272871 n=1 Tax=Saccostrea cuccullata TaxID=36930 RepID=UPI002ED5F628